MSQIALRLHNIELLQLFDYYRDHIPADVLLHLVRVCISEQREQLQFKGPVLNRIQGHVLLIAINQFVFEDLVKVDLLICSVDEWLGQVYQKHYESDYGTLLTLLRQHPSERDDVLDVGRGEMEVDWLLARFNCLLLLLAIARHGPAGKTPQVSGLS